ncbi:glycoside hydrolase family 88 protein [Prevotella sp. lc2012]|uniref:glycoside hydrolase family 88/105 protein n=1 Tax=Prevotella sp. lc2012 TaxID=1761886 RepID=UPI000895FC9E|nr:glycoside hydrolase family 88 protein [Prevotella sp. lc2012]SEE50274.1 Rhamnogalacturonyl hydrolase YesR [Prevotella sp. lc2012]
MRKIFLTIIVLLTVTVTYAQGEKANEVMNILRQVNNYFMAKHSDPTLPTNVGRIRPSSLWTRGVYYEGLMALYEIDADERYIDYTDRWACFHQWTPRNGVKTNDADDQCCGQTYVDRYLQSGGKEKIIHVITNLNNQMSTPNTKASVKQALRETNANGELYGWWTWIDAIQMAMPLYMQVYKVTGDRRYADHAMKMYRWTRDTLAGGLFNEREGLWWRDKDFVAPYQTPDGKNCYWSRGNGWVYAALVRCMNQLSPKDQYYKELKKDFLLMSSALKACQRPEDGLWNPSLVSYADFGGKETTGTALFLYGMAWGIRKGILKEKKYKSVCDRAWEGLVRDCVHPNGFLGWVQGTGKAPSDGQPLSYTKVPDFEDYGTGCFLLGGTEYYKLVK